MNEATKNINTKLNSNMQIVEKSSVEVAQFNAENAAIIAAGLVEAQQPSERVLRVEKEQKRVACEQAEHDSRKLAVLRTIWNALPVFVRANYVEPLNLTDVNMYSTTAGFKRAKDGCFLSVELEKFTSDTYTSRNVYWRVVIGCFGNNKTFVKLNPSLDILPAQAAKAAKLIEGRLSEVREKAVVAKLKDEADARRTAWLAVKENNELALAILNLGFVSPYDANVGVLQDGSIRFNYATHTVEQWQQIAALKTKHKAELAALEESFKA